MNRRPRAALVFALLVWCFAGASAPPASFSFGGADSSIVSATQSMKVYERSFKPSQYEPDPIRGVTFQAAIAVPETVQGFRVQLLSTNEYDDAAMMRSTLEQTFPDTWIYTVYDAPTYKVRIGDYLTRGDAAMMMDSVAAKGQKGAWIVPDRVIKNPPPKPPKPMPADTTNSLLQP
ncbi:MAG: SPOR domain-containing protein [Ignavibacteriales bacterium]|nr:SPOR domain-containing protein [Ignavibacteriales bacterium]